VQLVIADTGPVNYLLLIGHIDVLPALFEKVILPSAVRDELSDPRTPASVRNWIADPPSWVDVRHTANPLPGRLLDDLGAGETAALTLAAELHADLVLIDDRQAVAAAHEMGLTVTGTMGLLARASARGLIDLAEAFSRLKLTNFRYRQETMDSFLGR
jgi:predicted nucleic acid-binding protein